MVVTARSGLQSGRPKPLLCVAQLWRSPETDAFVVVVFAAGRNDSERTAVTRRVERRIRRSGTRLFPGRVLAEVWQRLPDAQRPMPEEG